MKRVAIQASILVLVSSTAYSQNINPTSASSHWLKYSLIFLKGCQPRVSPNNISFTEGGCSFSAYPGLNLLKGTKVELRSIHKKPGFATISFKHQGSNYEVLLKNDSATDFRKSLNLLFSKKELPDDSNTCPEDLKMKRQVIECVGFPIYIRKKGNVEEYHYNLEFVGFSYYGFDVWVIRIKNDRVINVSGSI